MREIETKKGRKNVNENKSMKGNASWNDGKTRENESANEDLKPGMIKLQQESFGTAMVPL